MKPMVENKGILWAVLSFMVLLLCESGLAAECVFYRVTGPTNTSINMISAEGWLTWSNAGVGTCTVERGFNLLDTNCWHTLFRSIVSGEVASARLFHHQAPSGMVYIPAGPFWMGNCMEESEGTAAEVPVHDVYVPEFFIETHEVTKALWDSVRTWAGTNGYDFSADSGFGKEANHPAASNSWYDCIKWCNARSEKEGLTPCYYTNASLSSTNVYRAGAVDLFASWVNWNANGYRLPTEAEWEKAARGGVEGRRFPWGDYIAHSNANYFSSKTNQDMTPCGYDISPTTNYHPTYSASGIEPYTAPVGSFAPNNYGLYDTAGNVYEWCWDWYGPLYYATSPYNNPRGPSTETNRVLRGGGWHAFDSSLVRNSHRTGNPPAKVTDNRGLRCVRRVAE